MSNIIRTLQQYEISEMIINDKRNSQQDNKKNNSSLKKYTNIPKLNSYYWFYYISKYGNEYDKILELVTKDKFQQIDIVRNNTSGLKLLKVKKQTFEENIIYAKNIHISTLKVLAYYNQLSLLILKNGCYYFFNYGETIYVLDNYKMYKITDNELHNIQDNNYYIPMVDKIMYASSHYKVSDLCDIAKQLDLPYNKMLKADLYNSIKIKLMQII
tara:strand:+ start:7544 stop:8185 length:642 start_codon:yes stop_codon:yes gene_type:complete